MCPEREAETLADVQRVYSQRMRPPEGAANPRRYGARIEEAINRLGSGQCLHTLTGEQVRKLSEAASLLDPDREAYAMWAGRALVNCIYAGECLWLIASWKSARRGALTLENCTARIETAIAGALAAQSPDQAIAALIGLRGVGIPMGSAILTCMNPEKYTVIDVRALDALGFRDLNPNAALYGAYVQYCRTEAKRLGVSLRQLDLALWLSGRP